MAEPFQTFVNTYNGTGHDMDGAYGYQCPRKGTMILKSNGEYVPVENLFIGDVLHGGNVVVSNHARVSQIIRVETDLGELYVSPNHRFIMSNGEEKRVDDLELNDRIALDDFGYDYSFDTSKTIHFGDKAELLQIQKACIMRKWVAKLYDRGGEHCLLIDKSKEPLGKIISISESEKDEIYVLNVTGDHTYYAENHKYHNCWDGYAFYMQWLGYSYAHCTATGGAVDIWTLRATNGMLNSCEVITSNPQNGDIAVWGTDMGGGYGHVAMYYNGQYMGQNQSGGSSTGAPFSIISISTAPLGWFRPNCYKGGSGGDTYKLQLTLVSGLVVGAKWVKQ